MDYAYTADGKLASRTWARGVTTSYDYNAAGDLVSIDYSDSTPDVRFTYDRLGRVLSATNSAAAYFYAYDAFGRLTNEVGPYATLARHYDELGRPIGYDLLDGYTGTLSRVRYEYAADGRFAAVVWTNRGESTGYRADYSYLAGSGLLAALTNSSGLTWTRSYEAHRDLLTAVENRNGTNLLSRYDYANDALGRRTARQDSFEFPVSSFVQNSFDYNERSELTSALMGTNVYAYEFDPIGNRREASRLEAAQAVTNLYASNPLNQYTNILCASAPLRETLPTYDADGNMLTNGAWSYAWDAENRLKEVLYNGQSYSTFSYDHQSRLVDVRNWYNFAYDGWNLVRRGQQDQLECTVWGLDLSGGLQGAGGIGGLLSMSGYYWEDEASRTEARVTAHYGFDGNGNVTDLAGRYFDQPEATGHYDYDPFGRRRNSSFTQPFGHFNFFGFSTKFAEYYTPSLVYYGYRWYDPELGRWLSRDPIGEAGGANLYCLVRNAITSKNDAFGLTDGTSVSVEISDNNVAIPGSNPNPCVKACADYYNRTRKQRKEQGITLCFRQNQKCGCAWQRNDLPPELVQCTVEHEAMHVSPPYVTSTCNYDDKCANKPDGLYSTSALDYQGILDANPSFSGIPPVKGRPLDMPVSECPAYQVTFSCLTKVREKLRSGTYWPKYVEKWNKALKYWQQYQCQQMYPKEPAHTRETE